MFKSLFFLVCCFSWVRNCNKLRFSKTSVSEISLSNMFCNVRLKKYWFWKLFPYQYHKLYLFPASTSGYTFFFLYYTCLHYFFVTNITYKWFSLFFYITVPTLISYITLTSLFTPHNLIHLPAKTSDKRVRHFGDILTPFWQGKLN